MIPEKSLRKEVSYEENRLSVFVFTGRLLFNYLSGVFFEYFQSYQVENIPVKKKQIPKKETHYHWSANPYHTPLIIRIIQKSCIYFVEVIRKQDAVFI